MKKGILPGDRSILFEKRGLRLGMVGLNSAFLQLESRDYERHLALDPRQLQAVCDGDPPAWARSADVTLLLTHHPLQWLNPRAQEDFREHIAPPGRFLAHLFGHMHEPTAQFQRVAALPRPVPGVATLRGALPRPAKLVATLRGALSRAPR